jgi:hypothetical protein
MSFYGIIMNLLHTHWLCHGKQSSISEYKYIVSKN